MPSFRTKHRVEHAAGDMFDLVADMDSYPQFVPLCSGMRVYGRRTLAEGVEACNAEMTVSYKLVRERFTSRVTLDRPSLTISVEFISGPFRSMSNKWTFTPLADKACEVEFFITYEFKSRALGLLMGAMFDTAFRRFARAFEKRADAILDRKPAQA